VHSNDTSHEVNYSILLSLAKVLTLQGLHTAARDRVALLLDPDSPFLELGAFAGYRLGDSTPCASTIGGIGFFHNRPCVVLSHVPAQSGGVWNEYTGELGIADGVREAYAGSHQEEPHHRDCNRE